ncbi:DAK2 domain-containing protein [Conexibacter sp. JD483]|uniref:DAK2 domain-containing protein n=1 Tax=unclassified Conexibacter TaxID=2627773 RepID=UPI00271BA6DA|nr:MULTISPECIES: DAK2 domain-containing protein [unclassified Conexibacter]MDO8184548.1 DAK2 domain-containing protein [Conexibacter sp. CPCC 205706]MDO8197854.1 DAK2 domain-containing protein [Conexibacter sp. CPCC 205762]MDR9370100.1 DAK2 domain-containing protein [Conexibacter sp. JD483]
MSDPSLLRFRAVVDAALVQLESRRDEVNDLNVFPVADGDTGDNMALTLRAVLAEIDRLLAEPGQNRTLDEIGRDEIVASVARAALLGARGNSGVILSQLIRGAAEELASRPGELVDPVLIGAAMARAAEQAYGSVRNPAEGTILTVVREMAHRIATELAHMPQTRLDPDAAPQEQDALIADVLERALDAGQQSVARGPDLLPILREAGVVDAGGYGLTVLFAGVVAALRGSEPPELAHHRAARVTRPQHDSSTYRYCTNFAVTGSGLDARRFVPALEALGDSVLVVGDAQTLKVHVHTDDPDAAAGVFAADGTVSHLDVADMHAQVEERAERLSGSDGADAAAVPPATAAPAPTATTGVLAVVSGDGVSALFEGLGAHVLDGGPTLNPSTYELLAGIHDVPAEQVVVLPNSSNVFMAAERAAELSEKRVVVVRAAAQQSGLVAAVALDPARDAAANADAMTAALGRIRTGAVAPAAREDTAGRFAIGDAIGFVDDELVAWGEPAPTLSAVLRALAGHAELITCLTGAETPLPDSEVEALATAAGDAIELDLQRGGQSSWWWLLSAE